MTNVLSHNSQKLFWLPFTRKQPADSQRVWLSFTPETRLEILFTGNSHILKYILNKLVFWKVVLLLIYLNLNAFVQDAGHAGLTEMTPLELETGKPSLIFAMSTQERSALNH